MVQRQKLLRGTNNFIIPIMIYIFNFLKKLPNYNFSIGSNSYVCDITANGINDKSCHYHKNADQVII